MCQIELRLFVQFSAFAIQLTKARTNEVTCADRNPGGRGWVHARRQFDGHQWRSAVCNSDLYLRRPIDPAVDRRTGKPGLAFSALPGRNGPKTTASRNLSGQRHAMLSAVWRRSVHCSVSSSARTSRAFSNWGSGKSPAIFNARFNVTFASAVRSSARYVIPKWY